MDMTAGNGPNGTRLIINSLTITSRPLTPVTTAVMLTIEQNLGAILSVIHILGSLSTVVSPYAVRINAIDFFC